MELSSTIPGRGYDDLNILKEHGGLEGKHGSRCRTMHFHTVHVVVE